LIAYENLKEGMRLHSKRDRRKSLAYLIDLRAVSGRSRGVTLEGIREMKAIIDKPDNDAKKALFSTAKIPT